MYDLLIKYGMIIVGLAVFGLLLGFASGALNKGTALEEKFQTYKGDADGTTRYLNKLCNVCLTQNDVNKDCFIVEYQNLDVLTITQTMLDDSFRHHDMRLSSDLPTGQFTLKLTNRDGVCVINEIESLVAPVQSICEKAQNDGLCSGLDLAFYVGYKVNCCNNFPPNCC